MDWLRKRYELKLLAWREPAEDSQTEASVVDWGNGPCPKRFLLNELAILAVLLWRGLTIWWEGALHRADIRYRSRTKLHCPFCGGRWHRDDSTINVPVRGGWYWRSCASTVASGSSTSANIGGCGSSTGWMTTLSVWTVGIGYPTWRSR